MYGCEAVLKTLRITTLQSGYFGGNLLHCTYIYCTAIPLYYTEGTNSEQLKERQLPSAVPWKVRFVVQVHGGDGKRRAGAAGDQLWNFTEGILGSPSTASPH